MIINEIVTNSLKYAFPVGKALCRPGQDDPCAIRISLTKDAGMYTLRVSDNGIGLPKGLDIKTTQTLGLKLVNFLAKHQMKAKVDVTTEKGTVFTFRFKE